MSSHFNSWHMFAIAGEMPTELNMPKNFAESSINAHYLGIADLEEHFVDMLEDKVDRIVSEASYEHFFRLPRLMTVAVTRYLKYSNDENEGLRRENNELREEIDRMESEVRCIASQLVTMPQTRAC